MKNFFIDDFRNNRLVSGPHSLKLNKGEELMQPSGNVATPKKSFTLSGLFSTTLKVISQNILLFAFFALLSLIPASIDIFYPVSMEQQGFLPAAGMTVFNFLFISLVQGLFASATFLTLQHQPVSIATCFTRSLKCLPAVFLAGFLSWAAIIAGTVMLVIPGIIIACGLYVVVPVCIIEDSGGIRSLRRSWDLTRGYRMNIFILGLMSIVAIVGLAIILGLIFPKAWLMILVLIVVTVFDGTLRTVFYAVLSRIKDSSEIASQENIS